jgi:putative transposase
MYQKYSDDLRSNYIESYSNGQTVKDISNKNNVPKSTIYYWLHQYKVIERPNCVSITAREIQLLERQLEKSRIENAIFLESGITCKSSYKDKLLAITKLEGKYPVYTMCKILDIRRSNYYHYKLRRPKQTQIEITDEVYKPIVKRIFEDTKGRIGSIKIKALMELEGHFISAQRVSRLMKELNLVCVANKKYKRYNHTPKARYHRNILDRNFDVDTPNKVWVSDITTVHVNYQPYYLCTILDLFSRKVVGYSIGNHQETSLIELAFKKAVGDRIPDKGLIFHSDQGMNYTSYRSRKLLRRNNVRQSFSAAGCPYDNAVSESFFKHFKFEQVYPNYFPNYNSFKESIDEYVDFFNNKRPHHTLKNKIPSHYEKEYFSKIS